MFSIHVFGTSQEEPGFPPENSDQARRVLHVFIGDFTDHSPKAVWGQGAELSITCSFQKLDEKQCNYSGLLGFNLRTLSCVNGWCLFCHAKSVLQPALHFLHRTSLLKPVTRLLLKGSVQVWHGGSTLLHVNSHAVLQHRFYGYPPLSITHGAHKEAGLHFTAARPVMYSDGLNT